VLFADEPTGNLDEVNAEEVMRRLHEALRERGASAIVVSHGIDLSMQFADRIVIMTKHETTDKAGNTLACGLISAENTYHRHADGWRKESDSSVLSGAAFRQIIKNHFDSNMRYEQAGNTHA
jgi:ABC-type phosphate/phosphonate transport system ATPase subunit